MRCNERQLESHMPMKGFISRSARIGLALAPIAFCATTLMAYPTVAQVGDEIITATQKGKGKPVEVEADNMEVRQGAKQAVFNGNVKARKGNVRITSKQLVVDYSQVGGKRQITFLNARGNVVVVSKGQTVKAQWAKMDVKANTVVMGDSVTVYDGKSVIHGNKLTMNLTTGTSVLGSGRVQGTFFE